MDAAPTYNLLGLFAAQLPPGRDHAAPHPDLNGVWRCDDGGCYFIRQIGPDVLWYGEGPASEPFFTTVAHGRMEGDGLLRLMWADVPKGSRGACGALWVQLRHSGEMRAVHATGGFGGRVWTR